MDGTVKLLNMNKTKQIFEVEHGLEDSYPQFDGTIDIAFNSSLSISQYRFKLEDENNQLEFFADPYSSIMINSSAPALDKPESKFGPITGYNPEDPEFENPCYVITYSDGIGQSGNDNQNTINRVRNNIKYNSISSPEVAIGQVHTIYERTSNTLL